MTSTIQGRTSAKGRGRKRDRPKGGSPRLGLSRRPEGTWSAQGGAATRRIAPREEGGRRRDRKAFGRREKGEEGNASSRGRRKRGGVGAQSERRESARRVREEGTAPLGEWCAKRRWTDARRVHPSRCRSGGGAPAIAAKTRSAARATTPRGPARRERTERARTRERGRAEGRKRRKKRRDGARATSRSIGALGGPTCQRRGRGLQQTGRRRRARRRRRAQRRGPRRGESARRRASETRRKERGEEGEGGRTREEESRSKRKGQTAPVRQRCTSSTSVDTWAASSCGARGSRASSQGTGRMSRGAQKPRKTRRRKGEGRRRERREEGERREGRTQGRWKKAGEGSTKKRGRRAYT